MLCILGGREQRPLSCNIGNARSVRLKCSFEAVIALFHVVSYQTATAGATREERQWRSSRNHSATKLSADGKIVTVSYDMQCRDPRLR
jgi:hypothetical protein